MTQEGGLPKDAKVKVTENDVSFLFDIEIKDAELNDSSATSKVLPNGNVEFHYLTVVEETATDENSPDFSGISQSRVDNKTD